MPGMGGFVFAERLSWLGGNFQLQWVCLLKKGRGHVVRSLSFRPQASWLTVWGHPCYPLRPVFPPAQQEGQRGL